MHAHKVPARCSAHSGLVECAVGMYMHTEQARYVLARYGTQGVWTHLREGFTGRPGDLWVTGYPCAGNSLMQFLVRTRMYACAYIYIFTLMQFLVRTCSLACVCMCMCAHVQFLVRTCSLACVCMCMCTQMQFLVRTCSLACVCMCMCTHVHTYI